MNADKALELARLAYPNDENLRVAYMLGLNAGAEWQKEQMFKDAEENALLLERAWLTLYNIGHEELAERLRTFKEKIC